MAAMFLLDQEEMRNLLRNLTYIIYTNKLFIIWSYNFRVIDVKEFFSYRLTEGG
jgi:hypothetical protein